MGWVVRRGGGMGRRWDGKELKVGLGSWLLMMVFWCETVNTRALLTRVTYVNCKNYVVFMYY